jgi:shikimate dehydrogenase
MFESVILPVDQYVRLIAECSEFLKTGKRPPVKLGLIGKDVSLSQSPEIHAFIAKHMGREITYEKVSIPEEQFESVMPKILHTFDGFNVTIPYKIAVIPYLKDTVGAAKALQTVNTVDLYGKGYSTDGAGFMLMLENEGVELKGKSVLLLGAGGASRAVALELLQGGAKVEVYSRTFSKVKELCDGLCGCTTDDNGVSGGKCHLPSVVALKELPLKSYDIIINVTGVGMHQSVGVSPVGKELIALCNIAVDLIYRPKKSRFLELAEECGKRIINGKAMLFYQAYISDLIYFNRYGWENNFADEAKELFEKYLKENGE